MKKKIYHYWGVNRDDIKFEGILTTKSNREGKVLKQAREQMEAEHGLPFLQNLKDFGIKKGE